MAYRTLDLPIYILCPSTEERGVRNERVQRDEG